MPLRCFHFPPNITMYLPQDWFTRKDPPVQPQACKSEEFDMPAYPAQPALVDERLAAFLADVPVADEKKTYLAIAVSEVVMNAMVHGRKRKRSIRVHFFYVAPLYVFIGITDTLPTLPEAALHSDPTTTEALAKLPDHGRGLFIIRQVTNIFGQVPSLDGTFKEIWVGLDLNPKEAA